MAAKLAGQKKVENAITGFGYNFTDGRNNLKQRIIKQIMAFAFKSKTFHFIFENPDDVRMFSQLHFAAEENIHYIQWIGFQKDMFSVFRESDIVVLPSYIEGLPKSLIEAAVVG
jgi:glycosyltransferase involved in cell wall biosynthesis